MYFGRRLVSPIPVDRPTILTDNNAYVTVLFTMAWLYDGDTLDIESLHLALNAVTQRRHGVSWPTVASKAVLNQLVFVFKLRDLELTIRIHRCLFDICRCQFGQW